MHDMYFWVAAVVAAALVGGSKGGLPMVGMLAVPILALVMPPVMAAGLLLPVYILSDMLGLWVYRKVFNARVLAIVLPGAALGIIIGWATAHVVPEAAVTLLIGLIGLVFALSILIRRPPDGPPREARVAPGLFWGVITGFTSFVSHSGSPPWQIYVQPLRLSKASFAGTSTVAFAVINLMKLPPYWHLGQLGGGSPWVLAVLVVPAALAVWGGAWLVRILPEKLFFALVTWALLLVSLRLVWIGVEGLLV